MYKNVKFANYPFHTQDQNPREMVAHRNFIHKITSHSGKTEAELRQDLAARKLSQQQPLGRLKSLPRHLFREDRKPRPKEKLLSPKDLSSGGSRDYSIELSFIDKIVSPEDNDQKYLGDYEMDHYRKGEETAVSAMLRRKGSMVDNVRQGSMVDNVRQGSIVDNIRKRIQQIESHESVKLVHPQLIRRRYQQHY